MQALPQMSMREVRDLVAAGVQQYSWPISDRLPRIEADDSDEAVDLITAGSQYSVTTPALRWSASQGSPEVQSLSPQTFLEFGDREVCPWAAHATTSCVLHKRQ